MGYKRKETKAKINWGWDAPEDRNGKATRTTKSTTKSTKKQQRETKKAIKTVGFKTIIISLCVLILCIGLSATALYFITIDDCFKLKGEADVIVNITETPYYIEDGYEVIEFGKDVSDKVIIDTNMLIDEHGRYTPQYDELGNPIVGQYYIIYKADTFKYSKFSTVERIRFVYFEEYTDVVEGVD